MPGGLAQCLDKYYNLGVGVSASGGVLLRLALVLVWDREHFGAMGRAAQVLKSPGAVQVEWEPNRTCHNEEWPESAWREELYRFGRTDASTEGRSGCSTAT